MNRLLGRMAMLSRAATELSLIVPGDDRLCTLKSSFHDAYRGYYETLHYSEDPRTNLEQNVDTLMDKITALATIFTETPAAFTATSPVSATSPLSPITRDGLGDTSLGDLSVSHPACGTTSKGTECGGREESSTRKTGISDQASKGSSGLKQLFGRGSGRNGKDKGPW